MFYFKVIILYVLIYILLFIEGFGLSITLCRGENKQYRLLLSPILGLLALSILPIYFTIFGIQTFIASWLIFFLLAIYSIFIFFKEKFDISNISKEYGILSAFVVLSLLPSLVLLFKTGYLTSTFTSYSAFATIPSDYFVHHSFIDKIAIDINKPITNFLSEVLSNHEYFGWYFFISTVVSLTGLPPYKLYFILSAIIGSLLPISVYIAAKKGFGLGNNLALFASFLAVINCSYFRWSIGGQMPIIAGMVYLILAVALIPSFVSMRESELDYKLYASVLGGILTMYVVLIPYAAGILLLYIFLCRGCFPSIKDALLRLTKLGVMTLLINPFSFVFLVLQGSTVAHTTSQFTNNIPRYPYIEEILGFGSHFSVSHDGSLMSYTLIVLGFAVLAVTLLGVYKGIRDGGCLLLSSMIVILSLAIYFYCIDFTYHFYKNAIIGFFVISIGFVVGLDWLRSRSKILKVATNLFVSAFVLLNLHSFVSAAFANHRVIEQSMMELGRFFQGDAQPGLILVASHNDPTEEAWMSYFLKDNRIKLNGSIEPWGFWIMSPFSGKPNPVFFFDPERDSIDLTVTKRVSGQGDIVSSNYGEILYENSKYLVSKGLPSPYLFKGWYPAEYAGGAPFRWAGEQCSIVFDKPMEDSFIKINGLLPTLLVPGACLSFDLNTEPLDRFCPDQPRFSKTYFLSADKVKQSGNVVSIASNKSFVPSEVSGVDDLRRLAVMIESLSIVPLSSLRLNGIIDIGDPADKKFLGFGWSQEEAPSPTLNFAWVDGPKASVNIYLDHVAESQVEFRAHPFSFSGQGDQEAFLYANGSFVGKVSMQSTDWSTYRIQVPSHFLKNGLNTLEFRFAYSEAPKNVLQNSADPRRLSAAFDYIKFSPLQAGLESPP